MSWVFGAMAAVLGGLLVWGLLAPRSQWRVLRGWSVADPHASEPGGIAYALTRLISGIGVVALVVVGVLAAAPAVVPPRSMPAPSLVERLWGAPEPRLLNRVFISLAVPPDGLVEVPVLGYQTFDDGIPDYLLELRAFTLLGDAAPEGLIGAEPDEGTSALGSSNLLVHVRGPILCLPRAVVVVESDDAVQVAVYYGLPDAADGGPIDHVTGCAVDDPLTGSLLIPVQLSGPVLERRVIDLAGEPIGYVER